MKTFPAMSRFPVSENVARMQSSATMAAMQAAEALRAAGAGEDAAIGTYSLRLSMVAAEAR